MKNRNARVSSMYNVDDFDFAIILQSKDVYAYWAKLLDFRPEHGYDVCNLPQKDYEPPIINGSKGDKRYSESPSKETCPNLYVTPRKRKKRLHNEITIAKDLRKDRNKSVSKP